MKHLVIYLAAVVALMLLPGGGTDAAKLRPAELVIVETTQDQIQIRTDLGDQGSGSDLAEAFASLESAAPGKIFLNTADYLLVVPQTVALLPQLREYLSGKCCVCVVDGEIDPSQAAAYLRAHPINVQLKNAYQEEDLAVLEVDENGTMGLKKEN